MQRTEQTAGAQPVAAGIPGTASNAPNTQALPVYPQVNTPPQSAKTETATYGVSKITRHTLENPGKIRRLTAAIVVNDRMVQPASGSKAAVWQSRSPEELRNLTALAQAAVGFDNGRGDTVAVEDLAFDENRGQTPTSSLERAIRGAENSPVLIKYGALVAAVLLVLALGVRPALNRSRLAKQAAPAIAELPAPQDSEFAALDSPDSRFMTPEMARAQEIFAQISETLKREPAQSSRLLQSWIHSDSQ
jgi:flagellar M-ring protein FliF